MPVSSLIVKVSGCGNSRFDACTLGRYPVPSAIRQLEAALPEWAVSTTVDHDLSVPEMELLRLRVGESGERA